MKSSLRICFAGASPDTGNLGVSALCYSVIGSAFRCNPDVDMTVFDEGHGLREDVHRCDGVSSRYWLCGATGTRRIWQRRSTWNIRMSSWLGGLGNPAARRLLDADAVLDITGGDSFTDLYGMQRFRRGSAFKRFVLTLGKPLILLPQTYGPYRDSRSRAIAADICRRATMAWARDARSFEILKELLGSQYDPARHHDGVDVAFALESREPANPLPDPIKGWLAGRTILNHSNKRLLENHSVRSPDYGRGGLGTETSSQSSLSRAAELKEKVDTVAASSRSRSSKRLLIGFNVSGLIWHDPVSMRQRYGFKADYREVVLGFLRRVLRDTDACVMLVPHVLAPPGHYESDPAANVAVIAALREDSDRRVTRAAAERLAAVPPIYIHPSEMKWLIAHCDWFCGTRMHACIAGLSSGVPTAAIAYSVKTQGVFETCGQGDFVADPRTESTEDAAAKLWQAYQRRESIRVEIAQHVEINRQQAREQLSAAISEIERISHLSGLGASA